MKNFLISLPVIGKRNLGTVPKVERYLAESKYYFFGVKNTV